MCVTQVVGRLLQLYSAKRRALFSSPVAVSSYKPRTIMGGGVTRVRQTTEICWEMVGKLSFKNNL